MVAAKKTVVAEVTRYDGPGIQVPAGLSLAHAIDILARKAREEDTFQDVRATIPTNPYDGAYALSLAMEEVFGFVIKDNKKDFFGSNSNTDLQIASGPNGETVNVPWGNFKVPTVDGTFMTGYQWDGGVVVFEVSAEIKGKDVPKFHALVARTKEIVKTRSIYRNKAIRMRFTDARGRETPIPEITFVDVSKAQAPIFPADIQDQLVHDVYAYATHTELVRSLNGGTVKRGILLGGIYGTGKTLTASYFAKLALASGWTFIYVDKPSDFHKAHLFSRHYQDAIIFVEDIDQVVGLERDGAVNEFLNVLDGADTKHLNIVCLFSTNHREKINPAMFRPGRIDSNLVITPPDEEAAIRLVMHYADGRVSQDDDFTEAGRMLAGKIPAVIAEAVKRARRRASIAANSLDAVIQNADVVAAARAIEAERTVDRADEEARARFGREITESVLEHLTDGLTSGEYALVASNNHVN